MLTHKYHKHFKNLILGVNFTKVTEHTAQERELNIQRTQMFYSKAFTQLYIVKSPSELSKNTYKNNYLLFKLCFLSCKFG